MIITTHPTDSAFTHDQAIVRALNSVTSEQAEAVANIAQTSGRDWDVQTVDDYDGYRFILIETARHGDEQESFLIAGTAQRLELFEGEGDGLALIDTFDDVEALGERLAELIGPRCLQRRSKWAHG